MNHIRINSTAEFTKAYPLIPAAGRWLVSISALLRYFALPDTYPGHGGAEVVSLAAAINAILGVPDGGAGQSRMRPSPIGPNLIGIVLPSPLVYFAAGALLGINGD